MNEEVLCAETEEGEQRIDKIIDAFQQSHCGIEVHYAFEKFPTDKIVGLLSILTDILQDRVDDADAIPQIEIEKL